MLDSCGWGPREYQALFMALTFAVMVAIMLYARDFTTAMLMIGLIANFFIISSQMTLMRDRSAGVKPLVADASVMVNPGPAEVLSISAANLMAHFETQPSPSQGSAGSASASRGGGGTSAGMGRGGGDGGGTRSMRRRGIDTTAAAAHDPPAPEGFAGSASTAPPGAGPPVWTSIPPAPEPGAYPGAVDFDELETAPALGHTDRKVGDPTPGNPYSLDRIASLQAAPPCVDDDALPHLDGDELNALHARARNDPERVWAGIFRRKALVDRYVRSELDEAEDSQWWGRHEI